MGEALAVELRGRLSVRAAVAVPRRTVDGERVPLGAQTTPAERPVAPEGATWAHVLVAAREAAALLHCELRVHVATRGGCLVPSW